MNHLAYNGYYLTNSKSKKQGDSLVICETVTDMDKRRIFLRSQVQVNIIPWMSNKRLNLIILPKQLNSEIQVINMLQLSVDLSFPMASTTPNSNTQWKDQVLKPGKKWFLPIESVNNHSNNNFIKLAPISQ